MKMVSAIYTSIDSFLARKAQSAVDRSACQSSRSISGQQSSLLQDIKVSSVLM